jgi:pilus assembly protein FimV
LPEPEIEWEIESGPNLWTTVFSTNSASQDPSLELEPLNLEPVGTSNAGKLEQAQTCIDDGDWTVPSHAQ